MSYTDQEGQHIVITFLCETLSLGELKLLCQARGLARMGGVENLAERIVNYSVHAHQPTAKEDETQQYSHSSPTSSSSATSATSSSSPSHKQHQSSSSDVQTKLSVKTGEPQHEPIFSYRNSPSNITHHTPPSPAIQPVVSEKPPQPDSSNHIENNPVSASPRQPSTPELLGAPSNPQSPYRDPSSSEEHKEALVKNEFELNESSSKDKATIVKNGTKNKTKKKKAKGKNVTNRLNSIQKI